MKLSITGLNHTTAPVEVRERLAFDAGLLPELITELRTQPGLQEGMILSTCNRVEIAVTADDACDTRGSVSGFLARARKVDPQWVGQFLYHYDDQQAIRHLFRVAASLDSMVVGEPQILGQLKSAYELAKASGGVNGVLDSVLTRAFSVAKRVRTETEIGQSAVSVSYAAVELAREIFGSLSGTRVILVGAGKMSVLAARHLQRSGVAEILVTNRSPERARQLASEFRGRVVDYASYQQSLRDVDVLIASTGSAEYILHKDEMKRVIGARRNRPMFLIDIAVPRNIDPAVNELDNVFLYDIDDLQRVVEQNRLGRQEEARAAEQIVEDEVQRMISRLKAREMSAVIVALQQQLDSIGQGELERIRGKLGTLSPQQEEAVQALMRGILNKVAHGPIAELRRSSADGGGPVLDAIRRMFRLGE
ncbi:MAG: glutamyl-tRNA reductase [Acidobacteria bacterium]|nr:glutamyl-tRNA reductase [Acidobacteriota bacterium]